MANLSISICTVMPKKIVALLSQTPHLSEVVGSPAKLTLSKFGFPQLHWSLVFVIAEPRIIFFLMASGFWVGECQSTFGGDLQ